MSFTSPDGSGEPDRPSRARDDEDPFDAPYVPLSAEPAPLLADTPMWLSHHWPDRYDRCARVAGMHICRRCLVLYPVAMLSALLVSLGEWWPHEIDPWVLWLAPLPGVVEFVLDNLGHISYVASRQVVLSAAGAVAAGVGYVRYLDDHTDALVWSVVLVFGMVCLLAAVTAGLRSGRAER